MDTELEMQAAHDDAKNIKYEYSVWTYNDQDGWTLTCYSYNNEEDAKQAIVFWDNHNKCIGIHNAKYKICRRPSLEWETVKIISDIKNI